MIERPGEAIIVPLASIPLRGYPMLRFKTRVLLAASALCLAAGFASAQVCSEWLWSNPLPQGNR